MSAQSSAPIIVKRKKVVAGGHHGGAWKVAYADFVTAMMAFFLLMWLLGATNEKQRIVLGGRNLLAGRDLVLGVDEVLVDRAEVLQRDHRAGIGKNTCHEAGSLCWWIPPDFGSVVPTREAVLTAAPMSFRNRAPSSGMPGHHRAKSLTTVQSARPISPSRPLND